MEKFSAKLPKKATPAQMRDFIIYRIENTNKTHDAIRTEFVKKFGAANLKTFNKVVSDIVD